MHKEDDSDFFETFVYVKFNCHSLTRSCIFDSYKSNVGSPPPQSIDEGLYVIQLLRWSGRR